MTHSTKRIATIHTQNHHTSHKTYRKSHKTYHKSHKTYHTSHKSHMIHDMQTSLDAFSSLPTLEAVYEMILNVPASESRQQICILKHIGYVWAKL